MRAIAVDGPDGPLAVTELPEPSPGDGELMVRVRAASINPIDVRVATGRYPWGRFDYPVVPGFDFAGVVEQVGPAVRRFRPGDEVLGYWSAKRFHRGSWAEYMTVPEDGFVTGKPPALGFDLAAAAPLAAATALMCIDATTPLAGETVLIVGAGGAIGSYAIQLAASAGATVVATGRPAHEARLRELGAAEVIDYLTHDLVATVAESRPGGVDALVDLVNDRPEVGRLSRLVRDGGRIASACFGADADLLSERAITAANVVTTHAEPALLPRLVKLVAAGELRVGYDERRPLQEIPAVVQAIDSGPSRKIVIDVGG